ncbi:PAS domain S-box-containing protein [Desulfonauticus submarinus]|uniref:histidine kinase n=1 Tax=Desulfonauticus submarinus TaxID=206665 RepID=A0A1H0DKP1_9BACT|nr:ATP-binding protein [Desulfonauticus submarinus]SDN70628.1 PAS domain S-box-containing protein [Desulfonauticus submarinus]
MIDYSIQFINLITSAYIFLFGGLLYLKINLGSLEDIRFWKKVAIIVYVTGILKIIHTVLHIFIFCKFTNILPYIHNIIELFCIINAVSLIYLIKVNKKQDIPCAYLFAVVILINSLEIIFSFVLLPISELIILHLIIYYFIKKSYKFKNKLNTFLIYSIILLIISVLAYFGISNLEHQYKLKKIIKANSKLKLILQGLQNKEIYGQQMAKIISIIPSIQKMDLINTKKILKVMCYLTNADYIWIINKNGIIVSSSQPSFEGFDSSSRPYFKLAVNGKANIFYALGLKSKKEGIFFARPIIDNNIIKGVLVLKFDFKTMFKSLVEQEQIFFMHKSGAILFGPKNLDKTFLYSHKHFLSSKLINAQIFGLNRYLPSAGYKQIKKDVLQDPSGQLWQLLSISMPKKEWLLCKLFNLNPIFHYRNTLFIIFVLLILLYEFFFLRIFQNREFISKLKQIIKEKDQVQHNLTIMAKAIEEAGESIVITDNKGHIKYVNTTFSKLTGYEKKEVLGKRPSILKSGQHSNKFYKNLWETIYSGKIWKGEFVNKKKNGEIYYEDAIIVPIQDKNNNISNFVGIKKDITEEKKLHEQIIHLHKVKSIGILAGGIAHDFNNMLLSIQGYLDLSLSKLGKNSPVYPYLLKMVSVLTKSKNLVNELLILSKKQHLRLINLNINEVILDFIDILKHSIPSEITITTNLEEKIWIIKGDKPKLEQVILNLILNAKDAIYSKGQITITTQNISNFKNKSTTKYICLSISDTGKGIKQKDLAHIFEPFFTTKKGGTGLGLSVVYKIIKEHKGYIEVETNKPRGTTFKIYIPAFFEKKQHTKTKSENVQFKEPNPKSKILIVEDDKDILEIIELSLIEQGYKVHSALNANQAKEIFKKQNNDFDLIISDMLLPDQNGLDLVQELIKLNSKVKIILNSGYTDYKKHLPIIKQKGFTFLQKPYSLKKLLEEIQNLIQPK